MSTACLFDAWASVLQQHPQWRIHTLDYTLGCGNYDCGNYIANGGDGMYRAESGGGNRLFVRSGDAYPGGFGPTWTTQVGNFTGLPYTECNGTAPTGEGDVMYSTCSSRTLFAAAVSSESSSIAGFRVEGVLGSHGDSGRGGITEGSVDALNSGLLYGHYKTAHSALQWGGAATYYDPSVNHLTITTTSGAHHSWDMSNRFDHDDVSFSPPDPSHAQIDLQGGFYMVGAMFAAELCGTEEEITTVEDCREAAIALGLGQNPIVQEESVNDEPPGCYEANAGNLQPGGEHHIRFNTPEQRGPYYSPNGPCTHNDKCICKAPQVAAPAQGRPAGLVYYMMWGEEETAGSLGGFSAAQFQIVLDAVAASCPVPPAPPPPSPLPVPPPPPPPPPPRSRDSSASSGLGAGALAGVIVGVTISVALIAIAMKKVWKIYASQPVPAVGAAGIQVESGKGASS